MSFIDERVGQYVRLFENIRGQVGDDQVAMALVEQCGKDWRVEQMRGSSRGERTASDEAPATPRQLAFLASLNVPNVPRNVSKAEASRMIDDAQARAAV
jgi:hypothetical protein